MNWRRITDPSDPTFLAVTFSLGLLFLTARRPWHGWPDQAYNVTWLVLWGAQALAACAARPLRAWPWAALLVAAFFTAHAYTGLDSAGAGLRDTPAWQLTRFVDRLFFPGDLPAVLAYYTLVAAGCALCVRATLPAGRGAWERAAFCAALGVSASLLLPFALLGEIRTRSPDLLPLPLKLLVIVNFLSPAIVLPGLMWPAARWGDRLLRTATAAALCMLAAVMVLKWGDSLDRWDLAAVAAVVLAGVGAMARAVLGQKLPDDAPGFEVVPRKD